MKHRSAVHRANSFGPANEEGIQAACHTRLAGRKEEEITKGSPQRLGNQRGGDQLKLSFLKAHNITITLINLLS